MNNKKVIKFFAPDVYIFMKEKKMKIKYKTIFNSRIEKVEIEKETNFFVFFKNGRRDGKRTEWQSYFDSFQEAKDFLITQKIIRIEQVKEKLKYYEKELEKIQSLTE